MAVSALPPVPFTAAAPSARIFWSCGTVAPPTQRSAAFSVFGSSTKNIGSASAAYFFLYGAFSAFSTSRESQTNCPAYRPRALSVKTLALIERHVCHEGESARQRETCCTDRFHGEDRSRPDASIRTPSAATSRFPIALTTVLTLAGRSRCVAAPNAARSVCQEKEASANPATNAARASQRESSSALRPRTKAAK